MNQAPQSPACQLGQFLAESLPAAALAHSYLVDLSWDPAIPKDQALEAFSDSLLHELHHHVALGGALLRLDRHDPTAWSSVGLNLARLLQRKQLTSERAASLPAAVRHDPRGEAMLALGEQSNRQMQGYLPLMLQIISATGWSSAAPRALQQ